MKKPTKHKHQIIEEAISNGITGRALGALLTGKNKRTIVADLVGTAIEASLEALKEAKKIAIPFMFEENGKIYKQYSNGEIEFVRNLAKPSHKIPSQFFID